MAYKRKIDRRYWDPAIYSCYGDFKRLRRFSLSDPERIERLRWRFLVRFEEKIRPRIQAAWNELARLGEAFYQREVDDPGRPVRIEYSERGYGGSASYDQDFWLFTPPKLAGSGPVRDLAEVGALREWEETELAEKLARVTEEKLKAGEDYWTIDGLWSYRFGRLDRLNKLLNASITALKILPQGRPHFEDRIEVDLNGRRYPFVRHFSYAAPVFKEWPEPDNSIPIIKVPKFVIDESLLGLDRDTVRTRHGEPVAVFAERKRDKWPNLWVYGAVGVRFDKHGGVDKILDPKTVTRLLRTAK